jgi:mannosyltransferase
MSVRRGEVVQSSGVRRPIRRRPNLVSAEHRGRASILIVILAVAAGLRSSTLDVQSYWDDEGHTVRLMRMDLMTMLRTVPDSESTPHLYYILAWCWSKIFGVGEIGLRSLSAFFGTATVAVGFAATRTLFSTRAGLVAAVLLAVNPLLIWYSQEARSYALLALSAGMSFHFFVRAVREPRSKALWFWSLTSALALATHYFAVFIVAAEALWLLVVIRPRHLPVRAVIPIAVVGAALLPLAEHQRHKEFDFVAIPLVTRAAQVIEQFLVGFGVWSEPAGKVAAAFAALMVAVGLWLLIQKASREHQRGALMAGAIGAFGVVAPLVLAAGGVDYLKTQNVLPSLLPLAAVAAIGFARSRLGLAAAGGYCIVALAVSITVVLSPQFHRQDLRGAADAIGALTVTRAIAISPPSVLDAYLPALQPLPARGTEVSEVVIIGMATKEPGEDPTVPRTLSREIPAPGFKETQRVDAEKFTLVRFRSQRPRIVKPTELASSRLGDLSLDYTLGLLRAEDR